MVDVMGVTCRVLAGGVLLSAVVGRMCVFGSVACRRLLAGMTGMSSSGILGRRRRMVIVSAVTGSATRLWLV
jgi:hypothetical protein